MGADSSKPTGDMTGRPTDRNVLRRWRLLLNHADELELDGHRERAIELAERVLRAARAACVTAHDEPARAYVVARAEVLLTWLRDSAVC